MFNVLVVDDDMNVRNGLKVLVPWEDYGFEIIDSAMDGKDALEKYKQQSFDLIVVDIQMPRMDGLELIAAVRGMDPFVHFLVLTGHAEFDYAKKAIEWKVDGYILKPIDEEELIDNLKRIRTVIKMEQEEKLFITGDNNWRCEMLIQSILSGNTTEHNGELTEKASQIGLSWPSYQVLLIQPESDERVEQTIQVNIRRCIKHIFNNNSKGIVFKWESFHGILLNDSITTDDRLKLLYDELSRSMGETELTYYSAIGRPVSRLADIANSYETAARLLKNRFTAGKKQILRTAPDPLCCLNSSETDNGFDLQSAAVKLYYAMDIGNMDTVGKLVSEWESRMIGIGHSEKRIKTALMQIINSALNKLSHADRLSQNEMQGYIAGLAEIYNQPDMTALKNFVMRELKNITGYMDDGNNEALVKKVKDIVERNYCQKLTLEILAESFNYSSGYLGRLFKKHTGENFNTYVDKMRIFKAKELLQQGMKVYQVANHIGYSNVDYFHSKFRKYAGISPSNFRKEKFPE